MAFRRYRVLLAGVQSERSLSKLVMDKARTLADTESVRSLYKGNIHISYVCHVFFAPISLSICSQRSVAYDKQSDEDLPRMERGCVMN